MAEYTEKEAAMLTPVLPKEHRHYQTSNLDDVYAQGWADALDNLKNAPAADVAPVVHGRWETHYRSGTTVPKGVVSGCCDMWNERKTPYCPNCGCRMDGGDDE